MNPFQYVRRVTLELSNMCPNAPFHKRCPLNDSGLPKRLPISTVKAVRSELKRHGFKGIVAFHNYSEPLVDPRLFTFIKLFKSWSKVHILTSGWGMDSVLLRELFGTGVKSVKVTAYSPAEYRRFKSLYSGSKYTVIHQKTLDDRVGSERQKPRRGRCYAPLGEVVIRHTGDVALCCWDWAGKHTFGNLHKEKLSDILSKPVVLKTYKRLSTGDRFMEVCQSCILKERYA